MAEPDGPAADGRRATGTGWGWILAYGMLSSLIGLAAFAWPSAATYAAALTTGVALAAAGILSIGAGVFGKGHGGCGYAIGFGIVSLVIGVMIAAEPYAGAVSLTFLIALWLGLRGVMELAFSDRFRGDRMMMIALGAVNVVLALFVVVTIGASALVLPGYVLGISFLLGGIASIVAAIHHRRGSAALATPD